MSSLKDLEKKIEAKSNLFYFALSNLRYTQSTRTIFSSRRHKEEIDILKKECFLICKELEKDISDYFKKSVDSKEPVNFNIKLLEKTILMNKKYLF